MKHFLPLMLCLPLALSGHAALAQKTALPAKPAPGVVDEVGPVSDYTFLVDSLLANVNKQFVPAGILYDRVVANAALHDFPATRLTSASHLFQAYSELREAAYSKTLFSYSRTGLREAADKLIGSGVVPIGTLDYRFAVLDTLAEKNKSLLNIGGLYYNGTYGISPYKTRNVTLGALLADTITTQTTLTVPAALQLGNGGRSITAIDVSAPGLSVSIPSNGSASVTFKTAGWQTVTMRLSFANGTTAQSNSTVYVRSVAYRPNAAEIEPMGLFNSLPWTDYTGARIVGVGEADKYFLHPQSKADRRLRNVVVVLDGFDPTDKRRIPDLADQFRPLLTALESTTGRERDVVFLNFPTTERLVNTNGVTRYRDVRGGADYIERNALVLVELLSRLRFQLADPTQKITILGPSMGGLISRYALALMEKNYADAGNPATYQQPYWKHNTDTWISIDAPHGGANVPMGDQYFVDYFSGVSEAAEFNLGRLNSVAARQMMVWHNQNLVTSYHTQFMRNLNGNGLPGSMGFPQQARRVGIANGRSNGLLNTSLGSPGQTGLQLDVVRTANHKQRRFFYRSTAGGTQIAANMYFMGSAGVRTRIFDGEARLIVSVARDIVKRRKVDVTSDANGSYDLAPGGTFDSQFQIQDLTLNGKQVEGYEYRFTNLRPNHCFIPTVSALAYQYRTLTNYTGASQLPNPFTDLLPRQLVCNDETPFDAIYSPFSTNTYHVSLDATSQQFLSRELFNLSQPPEFDAAAGTELCQNGTLTLRLKDCAPRGAAATYDWTLTGPAVFVSTGTTAAPGGGLSQAVRSTGGPGPVVVSAVATRPGAGPSAASTYSLNITLTGRLYMNVDYQGNLPVCPGAQVVLSVFGAPGPYTWTRALYNGFTVVSSGVYATTPGNTLAVTINQGSHFYAETSTTCDGQPIYTSASRFLFDLCGVRPAPVVQEVYPNPADGFVDINLSQSSELADPQTIAGAAAPAAVGTGYELEVYNNRGLRVKTATSADGLVRLSTADLPAGFYHLNMKRGNRIIRRNLSVQH